MVIDKEQLISLLKEKTGQEREQLQKQLSELIDRIHKAAEQGKKFEVEGFGTFNMQEGNLQFEPSDTLETEINNKYAGMKPIELIGAFKQPEGDEIPDMDEETDEDEKQVWAYDDTTSVEDEPEEEPKPVAESAEEQTHEETEDQEDVAKDDEQLVTSDEVSGNKVEKKSDPSEVETDDAERLQKTRAQAEPEEESKQAGVEEEDSDKESDLIGQFLVAAVIVIALGVGGWLVYDAGLIGGDTPTGNSQQISGQTTQQAGASAGQTGDSQNESPQKDVAKTDQNNKTSEPEQSEKVANNEGSQPNDETQQQETNGLRGDLEQSIDNGYTIVVYSLTDINRAETQRDNLRQAGYRALINTVKVGGESHYRVGIGQFQTVDAAQQAVDEIPESFQSSSNHFIKRIQ